MQTPRAYGGIRPEGAGGCTPKNRKVLIPLVNVLNSCAQMSDLPPSESIGSQAFLRRSFRTKQNRRKTLRKLVAVIGG